MKAWISGKTPGVAALALHDLPRPTIKPGTMIVETHAAALNFSDLLMIDDKYQIKPPRPFTPGQEIAGVVVEAPDGSSWSVGDRIASKVEWGGFAEFVEVRTDMALKIPGDLDLVKAAALPVVYTTSMVALHHSTSVKSGHTVLVHAAAGGVGLAAVEIAKAAGATVIATAGSPEKLELARAHGADHGFNYRTEDWVKCVKDATGGRGADIIVDSVGGDIAVQSLRCVAINGVLLIVGFASGTIAELPTNRLLLKRASAKGVMWSHDDPDEAPMIARMTTELMAILAEGGIDPVVSDSHSLDELPHALNDLGNRASVGKLVLRVKT